MRDFMSLEQEVSLYRKEEMLEASFLDSRQRAKEIYGALFN